MSAIGEYIHLKKENYMIHGVSRFGESDSLETSFLNQRRINQSRIQALQIKNKDIEGILGELKNRVAINFNDSQIAKEIAENYGNFNRGVEDFQKKFREKLIAEVPNYVSNGGAIIESIKNAQMNDDLNFKELKELRKKIINGIDIINSRAMEGKPADPSRIQSVLDNTRTFFQKIGIIQNDFPLKINLENQNVTSALKAILLLAPLNKVTKSALNGVLGEVSVSMAGLKARDVAEEAIREAVEANIRGDERSSFRIEKEKIFSKAVEQNDIDYIFYAHASQNKVDVSITIKDQPLDISVKAYRPRYNTIKAHLQDITLLYSLASTLGDFANHWISLHAYGMSAENADLVLKEQMAYEALVYGNMLKKDASIADTFVAIDTSNGRVYTSTTYDMLMNNNGIDLSHFSFKPDIGGIGIPNNMAESVENRIAGIIAYLHKTKISVSYKATLDPKT